MDEKLLKPYEPKETEDKIYKLWEKSGFFNPDNLPGSRKEYFSIVLPPPNVTGTLHLGHALEDSIQDMIVRYKRMKGFKTLWIPGTDHAAIATQAKVEKEIQKKEGKSRYDLGREEMLKRINAFAQESHDAIISQVKKMGASLDWSREAFTLDEKRNVAVKTAFKKMYDAGLIYRGHRIVNWDPKGQTVISDDETVYEEKKGKFYTFKYGPFEIGTARPETKFGDKYVVMHPDDKRYQKWGHGEKLTVEWINGPIEATVIKDSVIDMEFGTGVMTITPSHSHEDFALAEKYKLDKEQIIDKYGKLLPIAGEFAGMKITEAREKIVEKLRNKGLLMSIDENYVNRVATAERTGGVIEPQIMLQWFINVNKPIKERKNKTLKDLMREPIEKGEIKILPEHFEKVYFNWISNLRDWCISRQIWYGHRIPVWYCGGVGKAPSKKMGWSELVVPRLLKGMTNTYRIHDHNLQVGDRVAFENSQTGILMGYATITDIKRKKIEEIPLVDETHKSSYKNLDELLAAFRRHYPPTEKITGKTEAIIYSFKFEPILKESDCGQVIVSESKPDKCPACSGVNLEQDPDTLDTWFSSGLWTFSTLGWPEETKELKNFHPISLINPGYEILFFWVARMILMSEFLLGEIPFKTVFLHGILRDKNGKKFSKSSGNNIDPVEIINKYGADALRMSLISGTGAGNDSNFDENKVKGYKNFANKIWNITRFILENTKEHKINTKVSNSLIKEFNGILEDITSDMDNYRFHLAAEKIYQYVWHRFADEILEESKKIIKEGDAEERKSTLLLIWKGCIKILHPFMPFVTEEIWSMLEKKNLLIVEGWLIK